MRQTPPDIAIATVSFLVFWILLVAAVLVGGQWQPGMRRFIGRMLAQWKPSLAIAAMYLVGTGLGGRTWLNPYAVGIFCQALIGLTLAASIEGYEPLPVTRALAQRRPFVRQVVLSIIIAIVAVVPALLVGTIGLDIGRHIFGETDYTRQAASTLPPNKWLTFFLLFSGAGVDCRTKASEPRTDSSKRTKISPLAKS